MCQYNKENVEEVRRDSSISKRNSLFPTTNHSTQPSQGHFSTQNAKEKRLRAFKQQMREQLDRVIDPVDAIDAEDPQSCAEYATEIFAWLRNTESDKGNNMSVSPSYM